MKKNYGDIPLWEVYWSQPTGDNLSALLVYYEPYMHGIISRTCNVMPNWIDHDDLFQETSMALAGLIPKYTRSSAKTSYFTTYAYKRMHGAIVDYMRTYGPKRRRRQISYTDVGRVLKDKVVHGHHGHLDKFFNETEDDQVDTRATKVDEEIDLYDISLLLPSALQQYIFRLYFIEFLPMRLIAKLNHMSGGRVSQLIKEALHVVQARQRRLLGHAIP